MSIVPGRDVPAVPDEWVDAVNAAINDAVHDDLCACDGWPEACVSKYQPGLWDLGEASLHIAIGILAPLMRKLESERGDHWKGVATGMEQDRDRLLAGAPTGESDPPRTEWANRMERGGQIVVLPVGQPAEGGGERLARHRMRYDWYTALLNRSVTYGPWVEVPAESEASDE